MRPTSSYLFLNGLRFHYLRWGEAGPPLVLVHGLASNAHIWELAAAELAADFRVFALDQRNHGLTDPAPAEDGFAFATITRDLQAFIEALNLEPPVLVGHSWGAAVALHYAAGRPAAAAGMVLVDGALSQLRLMPGMTWEQAEVWLRPPDLDGLPRQALLERVRAALGPAYSEAAERTALASFRLDEEDRAYRRLPIPRHMQIARALYDLEVFDLFARLRCPALLCPAVPPAPRGEHDEQFLAAKRQGAARAEAANPRVRSRWFEDTVHDIPLHRPVELARAIAEFGRQVAR